MKKFLSVLMAGAMLFGVLTLAGCGDTTEPAAEEGTTTCLLYTSPSPRDRQKSRMPSSA